MSSILCQYDMWLPASVPERLAACEFFRRHHLHWMFCPMHPNSTCHNNKCIFAAITWQFAKRNGLNVVAAQVAEQLPMAPAQQRLFTNVWQQVEEVEKLSPIPFPWTQTEYNNDKASALGWSALMELMSKL